jgi:molecular chaperone DnaK
MVGGMTRMPKVVDSVREFFGKDPYRGVNPDEVVAIGAAVQSGVIRGEIKEAILLDVCPLSLGIETMGGVFAPLISRNTVVPCKKSQVFSTAEDGQTHVNVRVFQGEREMVIGNKLLGEFTLVGIPPAPRGTAKIEVAFEIDANSIVHVSARDRATGKEQAITIEQHGGLSESEIQKMVEDAEVHAKEDQERKVEIEKRNEMENFIGGLEKQILEYEKKLPVDVLSKVRKGIEGARVAMKGSDGKAIGEKYDELKSVSMELYSAINDLGQKGSGGDGEKGKQP